MPRSFIKMNARQYELGCSDAGRDARAGLAPVNNDDQTPSYRFGYEQSYRVVEIEHERLSCLKRPYMHGDLVEFEDDEGARYLARVSISPGQSKRTIDVRVLKQLEQASMPFRHRLPRESGSLMRISKLRATRAYPALIKTFKPISVDDLPAPFMPYLDPIPMHSGAQTLIAERTAPSSHTQRKLLHA